MSLRTTFRTVLPAYEQGRLLRIPPQPARVKIRTLNVVVRGDVFPVCLDWSLYYDDRGSLVRIYGQAVFVQWPKWEASLLRSLPDSLYLAPPRALVLMARVDRQITVDAEAEWEDMEGR